MNERKNSIPGIFFIPIHESNSCYFEIHLQHWDMSTPMRTANAKLYQVGYYKDIEDNVTFQREEMLSSTLKECVSFVEEYNLDIAER